MVFPFFSLPWENNKLCLEYKNKIVPTFQNSGCDCKISSVIMHWLTSSFTTVLCVFIYFSVFFIINVFFVS